MYNLKSILLVLILNIQVIILGQSVSDTINDLERTFMPQFQLGYVSHETQDLSGGLMTQTSIEYRDVTDLVFRLNFDVFNSSMNLEYPLNDSTRFAGKTSFSDLIGGIGYRIPMKKHHIIGYVQSGIRFYGYPIFTLDNNQVTIDLERNYAGVMRYTLGYEYALTPKLFFSLELLSSHMFKAQGFWLTNVWSYGLTFGITSPLF